MIIQNKYSNLNHYFNLKKLKPKAMSLLSANKYNQIITSLEILKKTLDEESWHRENQLQNLQAKVSYIQKYTKEQEKLTIASFNQTQKNIQNFSKQIKVTVKSINQTFIKKHLHLFQQAEEQIKKVVTHKQKVQKIVIANYERKAEVLQKKIIKVNQKLTDESESQSKQMKQLEAELKSEIEQTQKKFQKLKEQSLKSESLLANLSLLKEQISKNMQQIRSTRREKKQEFLSLLEKIIDRVKQQQNMIENGQNK